MFGGNSASSSPSCLSLPTPQLIFSELYENGADGQLWHKEHHCCWECGQNLNTPCACANRKLRPVWTCQSATQINSAMSIWISLSSNPHLLNNNSPPAVWFESILKLTTLLDTSDAIQVVQWLVAPLLRGWPRFNSRLRQSVCKSLWIKASAKIPVLYFYCYFINQFGWNKLLWFSSEGLSCRWIGYLWLCASRLVSLLPIQQLIWAGCGILSI